MNEDDLKRILSQKGYGIASDVKRGVKSDFDKKSATDSEIDSAGEGGNVESDCGHESLRAQAVSFNYTGKCVVRIKFFRRRLADYSRANCEKYLIDSLVYASLIRDDSEKEILLIDEGQEKVETNEEERVEITLEYKEVDLDNLWIKKTKFGNSGQ